MKHNTFAARAVKLAGFALLAAAVLVVMGCFYMPGLAGGKGTARARVVSQLPWNLTGDLTLIIGGPGMETIVNQYPMGTLTSGPLTVPSGVGRAFTLIANTPSVTLIGKATVDLAPGETRDISLTFVAGGSQIIVPDAYNGRLVQIADMHGTGWTELSYSNADDVDFDDQGRVYISSTNSAYVYRVDDITGAGEIEVGYTTEMPVLSIAVDRNHGLLYFTDSYDIFRRQVSPTLGANTDQLGLGSVVSSPSFKGLAVDSEGFVYVTNNNVVLKIDPNTVPPTVLKSSSGNLNNPYDVLVNGDYIYVSDNDSQAPKIVRLTKDLTFVDSFSGPAPGTDPRQEFVGPKRFVAILNKPITVIDEDSFGAGDKLVSFNDMTGAGWTTYGTSGSGQDQFNFYSFSGSGS